MKIVIWNCNMAYRKKAGFILGDKPDILIIPECEHPDKLKFDKDLPVPAGILWYGTNPHKGLGVFSYGDYTISLLDDHNPFLKTILPIRVTGARINFTLFAIWAYNPTDRGFQYIGQVWKAIAHYENLLKGKNIILAGDFNSNVFWDKLNRKINHSMVVEKLAGLNIFSAYHEHLKYNQGAEKHPTFYLYRHKNKPYHLDYCFASRDLIDKVEAVEIGTHRKWKKHSDHTPLIISFKL